MLSIHLKLFTQEMLNIFCVVFVEKLRTFSLVSVTKIFLNPCDNKKYKNIIRAYNGKVLNLIGFHFIKTNIVTCYELMFYSNNLYFRTK